MCKFLKWSKSTKVCANALTIAPLFFLSQNFVVGDIHSSATKSYEKENPKSIVMLEKDMNSIKYFNNNIVYPRSAKSLYNKYIDFRSNAKKVQIQIRKKYFEKLKEQNQPSRGDKTKAVSMYVQATAYTSGYESTGKRKGYPTYRITASGKTVKQGRTIACPRSWNFGTKVFIPYFNQLYICEDRGSAIQTGRIDIYMDRLKDALNFGKRTIVVEVLNEQDINENIGGD